MNPDWQPKSLQNEDLRLDPICANHFQELFKIASDPLIWSQHPSSDRYKEQVFKDFFQAAMDSKTAFTIVNNITDKIIGSTRFYDYDSQNKSIAIGFTFLARKYWGGKTNLQIKNLMLEYAFKYVDNVVFHIGSLNLRSQMATIKIGAKRISQEDREKTKNNDVIFLIEKHNWIK